MRNVSRNGIAAALVILQFGVTVFAAPAPSKVAVLKPAARRIETSRSGEWSSASTWVGGHVPTAGEQVLIHCGHRVVYDVESAAPIQSICICGALAFATDRDTRLDVGLITIQQNEDDSPNPAECDFHEQKTAGKDLLPALEVGSPDKPVEAGHTALIRLVYFNGMDKDSCPAIVCCAGKMDFRGAPMSQTWVKLGATANVGDSVLRLRDKFDGWRIGDRIIITATERDRGSAAVAPGAHDQYQGYSNNTTQPVASERVSDEPLTEERTIVAIGENQITLDRPLAHHHLGNGAYRGEVANLSRNVIVESADPAGVRGHTMYHRGSAGSISYAEFRHLGKRGVLGRYPLHFHRVSDSMRGSSVIGASIWDSDNRWLAVHATDYLIVRDCVGYRSIGHGFFVEDGTETRNVFDHNLAVRATIGQPLPNQSLPFDHNEGAGFWWANCLNVFTHNVASDCDRYGFRFEASPADGFDLRLPVRQADGSVRKTDIRTLPFIRFDDNEAHGTAYGINLGQEGTDRAGSDDRHSGVGPDLRHPLVLRNTRIWNTRWGVRAESPSLMIDGLAIHGCVYGFYRAKFKDHAYRNVMISNVGITEAFGSGSLPAGLAFTDSGLARFNQVGAALTAQELLKFKPVVQSSPVEISSADSERLVRGSYNNGGLVDGRPLPRIFEDATKAAGSGVSCGPLSSRAFPAPLDPVDDLPPASIITSVNILDDRRLRVCGMTIDNGNVKSVRVNGQLAAPVGMNFEQWQIDLNAREKDALSAAAEDAAGNVEQTPHVIQIRRPDRSDRPKS